MDVYAMAATFYRCVTGKIPQESLSRMEQDHLEKPGIFCTDMNRVTEAVIMKGLALRTEDRYMDMRSFYEGLKAANPQLAGYTAEVSSKTQPPVSDLPSNNILEDDRREREKNKKVQKIAIVCIAVLVVVRLIGFFL